MDLLDMIGSQYCGVSLPAGTEIEIFYLCACELPDGFPLTKYQMDPLTNNALGDRLEIGEPFDFTNAASGEGYWRRTKIKVGSGGLGMTAIGPSAGKTLQAKSRFYIVGTQVEKAAFAEQMVRADGCLIVAMKQAESPHMSIVGTVARPGEVTSLEFDGGAAPEDTNGAAYEITANAPIHYYDDATHGMDITPNP